MGKRGPKVEPMLDALEWRVHCRLDTLTVTMLRVLGNGNLSRGIRLAARGEYQRYQLSADTPSAEFAVRTRGPRAGRP